MYLNQSDTEQISMYIKNLFLSLLSVISLHSSFANTRQAIPAATGLEQAESISQGSEGRTLIDRFLNLVSVQTTGEKLSLTPEGHKIRIVFDASPVKDEEVSVYDQAGFENAGFSNTSFLNRGFTNASFLNIDLLNLNVYRPAFAMTFLLK